MQIEPVTVLRRASIVAVLTLAGCGGGGVTGENRPAVLTLIPVDASVTTQEVTSATISGARLTASSYNGAIGAVPLVAGRVNDSTVSFVVPAVPAGSQTLSITIGGGVVQAAIQVTTVTPVGNPVTYVARIDSILNASISLTISAAANTSTATSADSAARAADLQKALAARAVAQASFAALSPADQQDVAQILSASLDIPQVSPRIISLPIDAIASARQIDICQDKDIAKSAEEMRECQRKQLSTLEQIKEKAEDCRAEKAAAAAVGMRTSIRETLIQFVNFCHLARLAEFSANQWQAADFTVAPTFPTTLEELFTPITEPFEDKDLRIGAMGTDLSARVASAAAPMPFSYGVTQKLLPRVRFRRLLASDVGRIPAATAASSLLNELASAWRALNTYSNGLLGRQPATLAANTASKALRYQPGNSLRLGRVQPQAIRWNWLATGTGIDLKFDIDDKSADMPFTYDLIYDGGTYGADTVTINAVLTRDSVPIYAAAALGMWTVSSVGANSTTYQFELKPGGVATYRVPNPQSSCSNFADRYKDGACEFDVKWRVFSNNGRYYVEEFGFWNGYRGLPTPSTFPITGYDMVIDGTVNLRYRKI